MPPWQEEGAPNSSRRRYRNQLYEAPVFHLDDRRLQNLLSEADRVDSLLQSNASGVEVSCILVLVDLLASRAQAFGFLGSGPGSSSRAVRAKSC